MKLLPLFALFGCFAGLCAAADAKRPLRVAFVFDDGPVPGQTEKYLELFAREHVHVTFSYVGRAVAAHPELARAAVAAGHDVNNHSFTHPHLKTLDDAAVVREARDTSDAIRQAIGRPASWFWAPFLEWDDRLAGLVRQSTGLEHFPYQSYHFLSTDDWNTSTDAATILRRATSDIQEKTVILCHEWRPETLAQFPAIIAELRRQGCEFVTFSELAQLR